jgi:hypothetical protein
MGPFPLAATEGPPRLQHGLAAPRKGSLTVTSECQELLRTPGQPQPNAGQRVVTVN